MVDSSRYCIIKFLQQYNFITKDLIDIKPKEMSHIHQYSAYDFADNLSVHGTLLLFLHSNSRNWLHNVLSVIYYLVLVYYCFSPQPSLFDYILLYRLLSIPTIWVIYMETTDARWDLRNVSGCYMQCCFRSRYKLTSFWTKL
jgi:hypothetical protein